MRSREISVNVILQDLAQLKKNYKESWETVFGCCDTTLFLGGKDYSTWEYLSKMIGNATYDYLNISETKGSNSSVSKSNNLIQRPLIDPAEMGRLGRDECLVMIRGQHVFRDKKFNPLNHRNFNLTANADSKNLLSDDEIIHILDSAKLQNDESNEEILELTENQLFDLNIDFDDIITVDCR